MATDVSMNSFWMPVPEQKMITARLDLLRVYTVIGLEMWWMYYPPTRKIHYSPDGLVEDDYLELTFKQHPTTYQIQVAEIGVDYEVKTIAIRFLRIHMPSNYKDFVDGQLVRRRGGQLMT